MALDPSAVSEDYFPGDLVMEFWPGGSTRSCNIFVSGGDGFNFGTPCLLPQYRLADNNVYPDSYPAPANARKTEVKVKEPVIYEMQMDDPGTVALDNTENIGAVMVENAGATTTLAGATTVNEQKYIAQPSLSFEDYMKRPQLVHLANWSTTDVVGHTITYFSVPFGLVNNTSAKAVAAFKLLRCDLALTVKLNGTPFHAGRLICSFYPLQSTKDSNSSRASKTFCPHMFVDAQSSSSNTLVVPYRYYKPFLSIDNNESFGLLEISVFTALRTGTASATTLDLTIFASFPEAHLRVINQDN